MQQTRRLAAPVRFLPLVAILLSLALALGSPATAIVTQQRSENDGDSRTQLAAEDDSPSALIQTDAAAGAAADTSLRMRASPDTSCVPLGYASAVCPDVDWTTYAWIQKQALETRLIDTGLSALFSGARVHNGGTRLCRLWYADLLCRLSYPKCTDEPTPKSHTFGGPCREECEDFARTCPGLAMSCAAFDLGSTGKCWKTGLKYAYPFDTPRSDAHATAKASVFGTVVVVLAAIGALVGFARL